jgi:hypothetical protein
MKLLQRRVIYPLKIKGFVQTESGHCFFRAFFVCGQIEKPVPLLLMLDTGATTTTILDGDCERLGLDCSRLSKTDKPTSIVESEIYPPILPNAGFIFKDTQNKLHGLRLPLVEVIERTENSPRPAFSLMGVDMVRKFKKLVYEYEKRSVFLER